jgi:hypothetical protein
VRRQTLEKRALGLVVIRPTAESDEAVDAERHREREAVAGKPAQMHHEGG